ncbi:MAG: glycosyltransferase family 2 protein [Candidatus Omnitrophica bacterium]|nr:glycosyltransferase family 2 protein [Candidatus Omnitrophota bacterium]
MKICVVIPANNEAKKIGFLVEKLKEKSLDVLVIDDGSNDNTEGVAKEKGAKVIRFELKQGKGHALRRGFEYALSNGYDGIITMDGDGQHSPKDIDGFLELAKEDSSGVICGNRMGNAKGMPLLRFIVNWLMSVLISLACRQRIPDSQCGYRYLSRKTLESLPVQSERFEIETEILIKAAKAHIPILSVQVETIYGDEVSKIRPIKDTIRFFKYFFSEIFR